MELTNDLAGGSSPAARSRVAGPTLLLWILASIAFPGAARAQWQLNGAPLSVGAGSHAYSQTISDGAGGAIVVWQDGRNATPSVYAERVDPYGKALWTPNGVPVCTTPASQYIFTGTAVSDGAGGAIVTWTDLRSGGYDIYAQHLSAAGALLWNAAGVAVCNMTADQEASQVVSDGAGGAIIAWMDYRSGTWNVFARRINASGTPLWTANGVALGPGAGSQYYPALVSDGVGGAIVVWGDTRNGNEDIFAQRVSAAGSLQWPANGVGICTVTGSQDNWAVTTDGAGGAIVAWLDQRNAPQRYLFAQRVDPSGASRWPAGGFQVAYSAGGSPPSIAADGSGGAILVWSDSRNQATNADDIYVQRIDGSGSLWWQYYGLPVCLAASEQTWPTVASDGAGGAILVWEDGRNGTQGLYTQRVSATGNLQWAADGLRLVQGNGGQGLWAITADGSGNALVAWDDYRGTSAIYAQRIEGQYGAWGHPEPTVASVTDVPHDQGGHVAVNWSASGRDLPAPRTIDHYSIWRAVDAPPATERGHVLTSLAQLAPAALRSGGPVYLQLSVPPSYYWELAGTQDAQGWPAYSFSAPTRADSVAGAPANEYFMVAAHDKDDSYVAYASNALSGHSSDNLAPAPPAMLVAQRAGTDVHLRWDHVAAADLRDYSVYRATSAGVTPVPQNFLASAGDTVLVDAGAPGTTLYYVVTAYDVHQNESLASNEASVSASTGAGVLPEITGLMVLPSRPNPMVTSAEFEIGVTLRTDVRVEIFDVRGRRVRTLVSSGVGPGWVSVPFDGRDERGRALAAGVDFYRVTAEGKTVTRKLVIAR